MRSDYFDLFRYGVVGELALLTLPQKLEYFERHQDLVMVEGILASAFANALSTDPTFADADNDPKILDYFWYFVNRAHQALPTHLGLLALLEKRSAWNHTKVFYANKCCYSRI